MPRTRKTATQLRQQMAKAAEVLEATGHTALARDVREYLKRETDAAARKSTTSRKYSMPMYLRRATWKRAQAAPRPIADMVNEGFTALLAGTFRPRPLAAAAPGSGKAQEKGTFTTSAQPERQTEVSAYVEAHAEEFTELGWSANRLPSPAQIAAAWLESEFGEK